MFPRRKSAVHLVTSSPGHGISSDGGIENLHVVKHGPQVIFLGAQRTLPRKPQCCGVSSSVRWKEEQEKRSLSPRATGGYHAEVEKTTFPTCTLKTTSCISTDLLGGSVDRRIAWIHRLLPGHPGRIRLTISDSNWSSRTRVKVSLLPLKLLPAPPS